MRTKTNIFPTNLQPACAEDAPQKEKILRPECGAEAPQYGRLLSPCTGDAPQVSNDVYNQRYTSEKVASRYKQSGRSMIEMLGVLAIIGVLTVGSITGYSRAMRRHLLNKQREQYSYILSAVETHREMLDTFPNTTQTYNLTPIFETLGWIPEEMIKENDNIYIYDVFGNKVYPYAGATVFALAIYLANDNPHEQCVNLYQMIQQYHQFIKMGFVEVNAAGNYSYTNRYYGDIGPDNQGCNANHNCIKDLTPTKISELCRVCDNKTRCRFFFFISR